MRLTISLATVSYAHHVKDFAGVCKDNPVIAQPQPQLAGELPRESFHVSIAG
ncbi:MAG TPA: hypothetical protein VK752_20105 [Bryobacteraceae bacterium]|nr:hypothetical protein [Bryobacteraceae bacterium]